MTGDQRRGRASVIIEPPVFLGFVMATGLLHAVGIGIGTLNRWSWGERALQGAGAIVAMVGSVFLWQALA